jgi:lipid II:glycine glycyltransferase (peptidoglycan interpeptide bridge formation enzyme)
MEFDWSRRTIGEWRNFLLKAEKANWMQTWPYAQAAYKRDYKPSRLAIIKKNGQEIGLMAVQEIKLGPIQIVNLMRGPIWLIPNPTETDFIEFAESFRKEFPNKLLQRLRWMPNWEMTDTTKDALKKIGFKERPEYFLTIWLDLRRPIEQIRAELKQKWRNCLNKSERTSIVVTKETHTHALDLFLKYYSHHKKVKKFRGPSDAFMKEEITTAFQAGDGFLLWAHVNHQPVAGIAILKHGNSGSYRIGWNTDVGRDVNAHYNLLWHAITILKKSGIEYFDLGGIKPDDAQGISHFKQGLGGKNRHYTTFGN